MVVVLIGVTLASYLKLVANQNLSIQRSQNWNGAIPVAEAGIEEAMAHLNKNGTNRTADGWVVEGTNVVKERTIGQNKYKVAISKDLEPPVIICNGQVVIPNNANTMARGVKVGTTNDALFAKGMVAKGKIELSGNRIKTDSFDSSDPSYSTNGRYDAAKSKDNGDVATNLSVEDSLDVWNADIYGHASTGPGGSVKIGPNGSVGNNAWHAAGKKGLQPGWFKDDMNVQFPDVPLPFSGGGFSPNNGTVGGITYKYILGNGNYELSSLSLSGQDKVLVTGDAVLLVNGDVSMSGNSFIQLRTNATLQLYVKGASASIAGNGVINDSGKASSFGYWGLNSNKSLKLSGNAAFTGTIYAPYAAFTMGGGGNNTYDFVGASMTDTVNMNGHFNFHYDEALGKYGPRRGYTIVSWTETVYEEL